MRKLLVFLVSSLIALLSTNVMADGWRVERWVTEDGFEDFRIVDTNEPDLTDEQVRRSDELKAQLDPFYYDYDVVFDTSSYVELRQRGTGKVIRINKPLQ